MATKPQPENASAPLADYFFIAGIESSGIFNSPFAHTNGASASPRLESTVEEPPTPDREIPEDANGKPAQDGLSPTRSTHKRFSWDARKSISSIKNLESSSNRSTGSARSSATIKASQLQSQENGTPEQKSTGIMTELEDFEAALRKFTSDRDSVLADIQFSLDAGDKDKDGRREKDKTTPSRKPKTQLLTAEELQSGMKSGVGSVRRRLSTMNRLQKPGSTRRTSARMSKRVSGYNSVIPAPQRFKPDPNMHPLKRPYEPVLLDQYPSKDMTDETRPRVPFPDYIPMFVFPNDVNVVSSDERPRSTWHGFAMTAADGSRLYGITLIQWIPLKTDAAQELERQCEDWRQKHMTSEEREWANALGAKLAAERAKLSQLLEQLTATVGNEAEQERKQDEINTTEESISMMTEMLKPIRHGATAKIEGLTDGESGLWIPRAYGVLGREASLTSFWKEWLRVIAVPMSNGSILRVPPSSPRVGLWQPLERYVVNLCAEAVSPITSKTQVELAMRELRMYARKEATNEIPGSRNTDLYALFRCLDIPVIVTLFEFLLAESRIILVSSYTSMLHLASQALVQLLYPFKWQSVFIPVLPARLIQALEAPCPYICGIDRRYENVDIPDDDIVLVDLDNGTIEASGPPPQLPRQQRRKLISILHLAAPHRHRFGVPVGPPPYAAEAYPQDMFASESPTVFKSSPAKSHLAYLANLSSDKFGSQATSNATKAAPLYNVFATQRATAITPDSPSTPSPGQSPVSATFPVRNESSNSLQASLREKRSGRFDNMRRQSSLAPDRKTSLGGMPRPNPPFAGAGHHANPSLSSISTDPYSTSSNYAPSVYAQSTLAASTIMPMSAHYTVHNTETEQWIEGHCMRLAANNLASGATCTVCDERADEGMFRCTGCSTLAHSRCLPNVTLVCPSAFYPDQISAAFVRCFASLLYTYRKHMTPAKAPPPQQANSSKKNAARDVKLYDFHKDSFIRSLPGDTADYVNMLSETQGFVEFIHERETTPLKDPSMRLFDDVILSKRNRGRVGMFSKGPASFIADTSDHLWRSAAASPGGSARAAHVTQMGRAPAKLDRNLLKDPRTLSGVPRISMALPRRKQVPSMLAHSGSEPSE